jgi:hypothetical protein
MAGMAIRVGIGALDALGEFASHLVPLLVVRMRDVAFGGVGIVTNVAAIDIDVFAVADVADTDKDFLGAGESGGEKRKGRAARNLLGRLWLARFRGCGAMGI